MRDIPVITIDGPSGSGKGTISLLLAKKLGWHFLDSGAIYRVLAHAALQRHIDSSDVAALVKLAVDLPLRFETDPSRNQSIIWLGDQNITEAIREEAAGIMASKIAVYQAVRDALLQRQRDFLKAPGLVADGRDMGTVVFPDAMCKFYLFASLEERAMRRFRQLRQNGESVLYEAILADLTARDYRDKERAVAPLKPAEDALIIDTTGLSIQQVFEAVTRMCPK